MDIDGPVATLLIEDDSFLAVYGQLIEDEDIRVISDANDHAEAAIHVNAEQATLSLGDQAFVLNDWATLSRIRETAAFVVGVIWGYMAGLEDA